MVKTQNDYGWQIQDNVYEIISFITYNKFWNFSFAQGTGNITGKVLDHQNEPVEFVNVYLTSVKDTTAIITGTLTDVNGVFILAKIPFGDYAIHFQFLGFVSTSQLIRFNEQSLQQVFPPVILQPDAKLLNAIEISAIRKMIQKTEEGIVVNASENITQIGGSAADLMKNMPGVQVGSEGGITLRGKSPLILINGRVSGIGGVDRVTNLEQIPASSIERVEIITNPSAKYDSDAEGGIINIVLKRILPEAPTVPLLWVEALATVTGLMVRCCSIAIPKNGT
ncbi:MAG: carboxypeptidase-like regulatory domain-containing protein [Bacteroidales bacterium]|nr:carboxypeptidase-like regulatory domain-containing protein [Bacteroidales bacterium]